MSDRPAVFRLKAEATRIIRGALLLCVAAFLAPACRHAATPQSNPAAVADFHYSDPKIVAATGRPQLLEFVGPT
jgi:hypothetical protein